ncbi:MAG: SDR family NAD(P)-dependent oxidoreductase, partial [Acinetobacter sp.]
MNIQGKVIVITGGASGLGAATATHLVEHGAKVILVDMNQEQGQALQQQLGSQSEFVQLDVTDEQTVEAFFAHVE